MTAHHLPLEERFWTKVDIRGDDECWEFMWARDKKEYGRFIIGRRCMRSHRVAWVLSSGPIPGRLCVLHTCDNPPCCNPRHLFLGSNADNNADKVRKGRNVSLGGDQHWSRLHPERRAAGERHGCAKLTLAQVREIRATYTGRYGEQKALAEAFNVSPRHIGAILGGRVWRSA